ncbi:MAG: putative Metal-dependent hydrolases of the beta-lactamase superfamily II [Promethearchaeota archaeon]|nr:MAG: putative Metal-dependent hydrolases of the beta-lactamase superfamily II [Candidatus Lokiarchaeota archaeon]
MIKLEILVLTNNCVIPFQNLALEEDLSFIEFNKLFATHSIAEHGLGFLLQVYDVEDSNQDSQKELLYKCVFDTGSTNKTFLHNSEIRALRLYDIQSIVLSHWHYDHTGSLYDLLERVEQRILVITHEASKYERFFKRSNLVKNSDLANKRRDEIASLLTSSKLVNQLPIDETRLEELNAELLLIKDSYVLFQKDGFKIIVSGEIPRVHPEENFHNYFSLQGNLIKKDIILDDKCLIIENEQRTIILNGCCHSGIMNTIDYVRNYTNNKPISHVIGGFHMASADPIRISKTIEYFTTFKKYDNQLYLFPIHCTGKKFIDEIEKGSVANIKSFDISVGTLFNFYL